VVLETWSKSVSAAAAANICLAVVIALLDCASGLVCLCMCYSSGHRWLRLAVLSDLCAKYLLVLAIIDRLGQLCSELSVSLAVKHNSLRMIRMATALLLLNMFKPRIP